MRIIIATTQVPFVQGGAEAHAQNLKTALISHGHEAEIVAIPFKWYPPEKIVDTMLSCGLLDLTESCGRTIDRVIGLKFPAYLIPHPHKVMWILHQHRTAYELWDHEFSDLINFPNGRQVREAIRRADKKIIPQAKLIYTNSKTVSSRLKRFCNINSTPLYHPPPHADNFYCEAFESYLFFPSRVGKLKRQWLVLEALAHTRQPVKIHFAGNPEMPSYLNELKLRARTLKIENRVKWLGYISHEEKTQQYARSRGVVYPPVDEDYGYITLEAMLSSKPVITCRDSGGPMEFVRHEKTGLIVDPAPQALAAAMDRLWKDPSRAVQWGKNGQIRYKSMGISWETVVKRLLQ